MSDFFEGLRDAIAEELSEHIFHKGNCSCGAWVYSDAYCARMLTGPSILMAEHLADAVILLLERREQRAAMRVWED